MRRWQSIVDQQIAQSIGEGDVSHLPGAGEPLQFDDQWHTPADQRMAFKIMSENEVLPDWIAAVKALEAQETELRDQVALKAHRYVQAMKAARDAGNARQAVNNENSWKRYAQQLRERVTRYNRAVLDSNLKLPAGIPHRLELRLDALLDQALAASDSAGS